MRSQLTVFGVQPAVPPGQFLQEELIILEALKLTCFADQSNSRMEAFETLQLLFVEVILVPSSEMTQEPQFTEKLLQLRMTVWILQAQPSKLSRYLLKLCLTGPSPDYAKTVVRC